MSSVIDKAREFLKKVDAAEDEKMRYATIKSYSGHRLVELIGGLTNEVERLEVKSAGDDAKIDVYKRTEKLAGKLEAQLIEAEKKLQVLAGAESIGQFRRLKIQLGID